MEQRDVPNYAVFDDYRSSQRIAVVVRWFMLATWLTLINIRSHEPNLPYLNAMGLVLVAVNGYVHWRIWRGRPITWPYVLALSLMDLTVITAGIMITSRFGNLFYILYYPALLGVALIFRRRVSFAVVTVVAAIYTGMSLAVEPRVDTSVLFDGDEKELTLRVACMFAIVVAANLMTRVERQRRVEAVEAARAQIEENLQLQRRAEKAEREAQQERIRISQEIHDGAAQSAYMLSLGLETCSRMAEADAPQLHDRLKALHTEAKQALWELRYPINLGPLFEGRGLAQILADHLTNFRAITSIPAHLSVAGHESELPLVAKQRLFAVAHNALTNAYKYAQATEVKVELACDDQSLRLSISDNGVGLDPDELAASSGHGIRNMRRIAEGLGGSLELTSAPRKGTIVSVALPLSGGEP